MIVFYDLETTGLLHPSRKDLPGIIEIAAVKYTDEGEKVSTFHSLVDPELLKCDWEAGAIKTTGVSIDDIQPGTPSFYQVAAEFANWMVGVECLSGYNITHFDDKVLYRQLKRYGWHLNFPWPPKRLEVMDVAQQFSKSVGKRGNKPPRLEEIYQQLFDEKFDNAHHATADVDATAQVAFQICTSKIKRLLGA